MWFLRSQKSGRAEDLADKDAPGSDFIEQIARLAPSKQRAELKRIESLLQPALPRFSKLKCERDPVGRPHLLANYSHWRRGGAWQNEQEFSDGTLRLLGLFWAILRGSSPLLLEEPELSLHLDVAKQLPRLLYRATARSGRQVIVSSHAEAILSDRGIDPSEVILLEPSDNETKVIAGTDRPELLRAAKARSPLGPVVRSLTKPRDIEQLSFAF
jgi:predicted ATPase